MGVEFIGGGIDTVIDHNRTGDSEAGTLDYAVATLELVPAVGKVFGKGLKLLAGRSARVAALSRGARSQAQSLRLAAAETRAGRRAGEIIDAVRQSEMGQKTARVMDYLRATRVEDLVTEGYRATKTRTRAAIQRLTAQEEKKGHTLKRKREDIAKSHFFSLL